MLLVIVAMACLGGAVFLFTEVLTLPAREREGSIRRAASYGKPRYFFFQGRDTFGERIVIPLRQRLAGLVLRLSPQTTLDSVSQRLLTAGMRQSVSPLGFLAGKALLAIGGFVAGASLGAAAGEAGGSIVLGVVFAGIGYLLPDLLLTSRTRRRREQIRRDLPDTLDLLAVSVEAGLGFDAAIVKLTERLSGPLVEELEIALGEMRVSESRENALKKLAERVDVPEVSAFIRAMVQADQLGMSIGRILRVQASESRLRRQAAAEERAMKAPIKMLFPTALFIFPAMFIVVLGPAFISLLEFF
jgi:tight adherence protein C